MDNDSVFVLLGFLLWACACGLPAFVASEKKRSGGSWYFIGFFLSPPLALLALAGLPTLPERVAAATMAVPQAERLPGTPVVPVQGPPTWIEEHTVVFLVIVFGALAFLAYLVIHFNQP